SKIDPLLASGQLENNAVERLTSRLIRSQEEERQRIAREIHDVAGAHLALLSLSLEREVPTSGEKEGIRRQLMHSPRSLRELSHCCHSPLLEDAGLGGALKTLCDRFKSARGLEMNVVIPPELPEIPEEVRICLHRVLQESLQNIVRH